MSLVFALACGYNGINKFKRRMIMSDNDVPMNEDEKLAIDIRSKIGELNYLLAQTISRNLEVNISQFSNGDVPGNIMLAHHLHVVITKTTTTSY
jgi:hypothetical protein